MGGEDTGCTDATTDVFVESALFDPVRTAATGRQLFQIRKDDLKARTVAFAPDGKLMAVPVSLEAAAGGNSIKMAHIDSWEVGSQN